MLVSVVIPTCHRNNLLAKCLDRLAPGQQTLPPERYEVIVTDDGSKSDTSAMVETHYPWVRWVQGPRKGPAANRNNGARHAQGEWLAFTDDDCLPDEGWLDAFLHSIGKDILVYEGKTTCLDGVSSPLEHSPTNLSGGFLWSCNMMIEKKLFQKIAGFDEGFPFAHLEDVELRERVTQYSKFIFVPDALVDHPPRILPAGSEMGASHESDVYYACLKQKTSAISVELELLKNIVLARGRAIWHCPISLDSFKAIHSLCVELWVVILNYSIWWRRHSKT
ncbi:MAG TPA: glycosyltransferase [Verrucomicrobiae bacterium]|jgi:GT2 family glycosyltransferase